MNKRHSLSIKTIRLTVISCIVFGLVAQLVALSFYTVSFIGQYIDIADTTARQAATSSTHGSDAVGFSKQVMEIYNSLTHEQRALVGTPEYREFFSSIDTGKGSVYDLIFNIILNSRKNTDVYDVYIAMYDKENSAIVYIVDTDENPETLALPGDWEPANKKGMMRFLEAESNPDKKLYDIDWSKKYGLLCTVGVPIKEKSGELVSFMLVDISIERILTGVAKFSLQLTLVFTLITILLAWFQTKKIKKNLVDPINRIAEASQNYVKDKRDNIPDRQHFAKLEVHTKDEIENLAITMKEMELDLAEYESNLTQITAERERIEVELSLATAIQSSMLPHSFPPFPDIKEFDIYAMMQPARQIGGDFYDFFLIDDDHLCLVMADVSGKGIPAALFMMISKTILQSCAMLGQSASSILKKTNEALCSNNQVEMFVTVWIGILEISTGIITASNAGHEYPIVKHNDGKFEVLKDKHGLVIGGLPGTNYSDYTIELKPGDKLFVYTDGIPEAMNKEGKMFGLERTVEALNSNLSYNPETLLKNVKTSLDDYVKDTEQFDDITMLCLEYCGKTN